MTAAPRPGWYPDPAGAPDHHRWWTGSEWSGDTTDTLPTPAPTVRSTGAGGLRTTILLALGFTLFVGASVSAGVLLWRGPAVATGPSPVSSQAGPATSGQLDLHSRVATIGSASLTLPEQPYELFPDPGRAPGLFDVVFMANAPVHRHYDGSRTWSATVLFARLSTSVTGSGLEDRGRQALRGLSLTFFDHHPTQLGAVHWSDRAVSSCSGVLMTGRVSYAVAQLPSRFDLVTAQLVELPDATVVLAITSVPDDTDPVVRAQAATAVASLTLG